MHIRARPDFQAELQIGAQDQQQTRKGGNHCQPFKPVNSFRQERPGHDQNPEGHCINQNGRLSCPARFKSPHGKSKPSRRGKEPQKDRQVKVAGKERPLAPQQEEKEDERAEKGSEGGKSNGAQ